METKICPVCGLALPPQSRRGRPRVYHDDCQKLQQLLSWTEDLIMDIIFTKEKNKELRSHLWYMANLLNHSK